MERYIENFLSGAGSKQHLEERYMFKRCLFFILSLLLLILNTAIAPNSLMHPRSTQAMTSAGNAVADSFQRTITSGWGNADTGGWWTVVGAPWSWSVVPSAGRVTVGANSQERAYLSSFTIRDVDVVEKVVLPHCSGSSTNCGAYVLGRYAPAFSPTYYRVGMVQGTGRNDIFLRA